MSTLVCQGCGVRLSESSMKFHRQVCGASRGEAPTPRQEAPPLPRNEETSREDMRRDLNALREEVYGKPSPVSAQDRERARKKVLEKEQQRNEELGDDFSKSSSAPQRNAPSGATSTYNKSSERQRPVRGEGDVQHQVSQQGEQLRRLSEQMEELSHDVRKQRRVTEEEREGQRMQLEVTPRLEADINTLGRHVNALRDEVEGWRQETGQLQDESRTLQTSLKTAGNYTSDVVRLSEFDELRGLVTHLRKDIDMWKREAAEMRVDRDAVAVLRRDMRQLTKELHTSEGEVNHLRRQLEKERKRVDELQATLHNFQSTSKRSPSSDPVKLSSHGEAPAVHLVPNEVNRAPRERSSERRPMREAREDASRRTTPRRRSPKEVGYFSTDEEGEHRHRETENLVSRAVHRAYSRPPPEEECSYDDYSSDYSFDERPRSNERQWRGGPPVAKVSLRQSPRHRR